MKRKISLLLVLAFLLALAACSAAGGNPESAAEGQTRTAHSSTEAGGRNDNEPLPRVSPPMSSAPPIPIFRTKPFWFIAAPV